MSSKSKEHRYEREFSKLIAENKIPPKTKGAIYTHTCFGPPWGTYNITNDDMSQFLDLYNKLYKKIDFHFTEKPNQVAPLCVDIDFKFASIYKERTYKKETIRLLVNRINNRITEYFDIDEDNIQAFVFEKETPTHEEKNNTYKDGFHIMYPYIPMETNMRYYIIDRVREDVEEEGDFGDIPFMNEMSDVFDTCVVARNGWMMYGSRKHMKQSYTLTKIYDVSCDEEDLDDIKNANLPKLLSVRKFSEDDIVPLKEITESLDFKLRMKYTIDKYEGGKKNYNMKKDIMKNGLIKFIDNDSESENDSDKEEYGSDTEDGNKEGDGRPPIVKGTKEDVALARKLVKILSVKKRAKKYKEWIHLGWCLHNIDESLLQDWVSFSKKSAKDFQKGKCEEVWETARDHGSKLTIASLHHWAREDNIQKYADIMRESVRDILMEAENGHHYDVAMVIYALYGHLFVCSSIKYKTWYEFQGHRWVQIDSGHTLSIKISEELTKEFSHLNSYYYGMAPFKEHAERDDYYKKANTVRKLIDNLKKTGFKNAVLEQCTHKFYDGNFEAKLDENKDLLGFENGVYDLKEGYFREGLPDDYLTFSTGYNYKEYTMDHRYIANVDDFFKKIQIEEEMKTYLLTLFSSHLDGHNKQQRFILFTGFGGSNGKSTAVDFLTKSLGDYASVVAHTILTRKRGSSSGPTPELADKRGVRFIQINEPSGEDKIDVGFMKELSGNDLIPARQMYKEQFYFRPQFKMILICNILPYIPSTDGGTWRRLRVTPWDSKFIDLDEKIEGKFQFYKDPEIDQKMEKWKAAFMWLMLKKYYPLYRNGGGMVKEPSKVKEYTKKYKADSDVYYEYLDEFYEVTNKAKDVMSFIDMYKSFVNWHREAYYGGGTCPSKKEFKNYLINNNYVLRGSKLLGVKEREINEDAEMENEINNLDGM